MNVLCKERRLSVDKLRMFLIFCIIFHHYVLFGVFNQPITNLVSVYLYSFLGSFGKVSANTFFMISGYFLYKKRELDFNKVFKLYYYAFVITISMIVIRVLVCSDFGWTNITLSDWFILRSWKWWFLTTYVIIYLLHPLINKFIVECPIICWGCVTFMCIAGFVKDIFGYHLLGFIKEDDIFNCFTCLFCYVLGGSLHNIKIDKFSRLVCGLLIVGFVVLKLVLLSNKFGVIILTDATSLCIILSSLFLLIFSLNDKRVLSLQQRRMLPLLSSDIIFCIYLIHEEPFIRELLWNTENTLFRVSYQVCVPVLSFVYVFMIFVVCAILGLCLEKSYQCLSHYIKLPRVMLFN